MGNIDNPNYKPENDERPGFDTFDPANTTATVSWNRHLEIHAEIDRVALLAEDAYKAGDMPEWGRLRHQVELLAQIRDKHWDKHGDEVVAAKRAAEDIEASAA